MSVLVLNIEGSNRIQVVKLDDPSPGYAAEYVGSLLQYIDPACTLLWCEVDVSTVAEYGPDQIAQMLSGDERFGVTFARVWERATLSA